MWNHPRMSRRALLQAGAVGVLGLGTGELAFLRGGQPTERITPRKRVIFIFLSGGLAQHDSFDLKPDAPDGIRGEFHPIATRAVGVRICEHLPLLAERADRWALVRSLTHPTNNHSDGHHMMFTGRSDLPIGYDPNRPKPTDHPAIASIANYATQSRGNLPPAVVLPHVYVHRTGRTIPGQFAGALGSRWDPFFLHAHRDCEDQVYGACPDCFRHDELDHRHPPENTFQVPYLALPDNISARRLTDRVGLTAALDRQRRGLETLAATQPMDEHRRAAFGLLADPRVQQAFDVHRAPARVQERYGRNLFGASLLLARQLIEAGVNLVQVNLGNNETWDTHQSAFPNLRNHLLPPLDKSLSALLDDLVDRGLLDDTLIVMAGEFGRTPRISSIAGASKPGRDHWGAVQTVFFAGGGVRGGTVVGSSDRVGGYPATCPQTPESMAATIYHVLGIPSTGVWHDPAQRPHVIYQGDPIAGLL